MSTLWRYYAVAGQSNARGNNASSMVGVRVGRLRAWDFDAGAFALGTARDIGDWYNASGTPSAPRVGVAAGIAEAYASRLGEGAGICQYSVGETTCQQWIDTYAPAHIAAMQAYQAAWGFSEWEGLVWAQGESDTGASGAYSGRLATLLALYRATFPGLKVALVKLAPGIANGPTMRAAQEEQVDVNTCTVSIDDHDGTQHDGTHHIGVAQRACGIRAVAGLRGLHG